MSMDYINVPFDDSSVNIAEYTVESTSMFSRRTVFSIAADKTEMCKPTQVSEVSDVDKTETVTEI